MDKPYIINDIEIKPGMGLILFDKDDSPDHVYDLFNLYIVFPVKNDLGCISYYNSFDWDLLSTVINNKIIYKIYDLGDEKSIFGKLLLKNPNYKINK